MIRFEDDVRQALDAEPDPLSLARLNAFIDVADDRQPTVASEAAGGPRRRSWAPLVAAAAVIVTVSGAAVVAVERQRPGPRPGRRLRKAR